MAISQAILGMQPGYDGLEINPVFPTSWPGFEAVRVFRGVKYTITVVRAGKENGIQIEVDGQKIEGTRIPLPPVGTKQVAILVTVG